jgi:hypothetical protein
VALTHVSQYSPAQWYSVTWSDVHKPCQYMLTGPFESFNE